MVKSLPANAGDVKRLRFDLWVAKGKDSTWKSRCTGSKMEPGDGSDMGWGWERKEWE